MTLLYLKVLELDWTCTDTCVCASGVGHGEGAVGRSGLLFRWSEQAASPGAGGQPEHGWTQGGVQGVCGQ